MPANSHRPVTLYALITCLLLLSIGAFFGAYHLLTDPSGVSIGFPPEMLSRLPLPDFTLPGLFLLVVYAFGTLVVIYALLRHMRIAWWAALALGVVLVCWVIGELIMFQLVVGIMIVTASLGILIIAFTFAPPTRRQYTNG